jgi:hypothetical protein
MSNGIDTRTRPRQRDPTRERRERQRYRILQGVYERAGMDRVAPVSGLEVGEEAGLSREDTFRNVLYLAQRGLLDYVGAGPRVCITPEGVDHLQRVGRRRSIREP